MKKFGFGKKSSPAPTDNPYAQSQSSNDPYTNNPNQKYVTPYQQARANLGNNSPQAAGPAQQPGGYGGPRNETLAWPPTPPLHLLTARPIKPPEAMGTTGSALPPAMVATGMLVPGALVVPVRAALAATAASAAPTAMTPMRTEMPSSLAPNSDKPSRPHLLSPGPMVPLLVTVVATAAGTANNAR